MKLKKILQMMLFAPLAIFGIVGVGTDAPATDPAGNAAEDNGGDQKGDAGNPADTVSTSEKPEQTEKKFTQAELDKAISERLARERKNMPSKDDLKAFKAWQESQKSPEQKAAEKVLETANADDKVKKLEIKVACLSLGVASASLDDVITLAERYVSDDVSIDEAISKVLEKYPSFRSAGETKKGDITTGVITQKATNNGGNSTLKTIDIIKQNQVKRK